MPIVRLTLLFAIVLVAYDIFAAYICTITAITYDSFLFLQVLLVFCIGVYSGMTMRSWSGMIAVIAAACIEATLGWYIAARMGPGYVPGWTLPVLAFMSIVDVLRSALAGAAGLWLGLRIAGARRGLF